MPASSSTPSNSEGTETSPSGAGVSPENGVHPGALSSGPAALSTLPVKRSRVLLSCGPCRYSKLKCDRQTPCGQCLKKGRVEACVYAPKPEKPKPSKSMAARLKRLEGMVRDMMDHESPALPGTEAAEPTQGRGQVVLGKDSATYVGATHFMAMLDDIEDLKGYFEDDDSSDESPEPDSRTSDLFILSSGASRPTSREELLGIIPPKEVADRLIHRYFNASSPSQHIIHRPTFLRQYGGFCKDPRSATLEWIALLLLVLALGTFFSTFTAPHELEQDLDLPPMDRFRRYRGAAAWALVQSKYTNPKLITLPPLLLYIEGEFLINRASQMPCYVLMGVCIRIMLKMGLHRDPGKLPNISPFDGEMRRRMWNLAVQIDLIVSFHTGLPSMIHGIESDTCLPRNLMDDDLDENCAELPPARADTVYTQLTYPIWKSTICRVFGLVARQAHSLSLPSYAEVMRLDHIVEEKWRMVPSFMKIKPLAESIGDPPAQVNQRFGLASLYQKCRCVLHRRYLIEAVPRKEHAHSRRVCLEAALALLEYQYIIHQSTKPGGVLRQNGWFVTSLAVHDFLLGAMVVYLVLQNEAYSEVGENYDWMEQGTPLPSKQGLQEILTRSYHIWLAVSRDFGGARKACNIVETMLRKLHRRGDQSQSFEEAVQSGAEADGSAWFGMNPDFDIKHMEPVPILGLALSDPPPQPRALEPMQQVQVGFSRNDLVPGSGPVDTPWLDLGAEPNLMNWDTFDQAVNVGDPNAAPDPMEEWLNQQTPWVDGSRYVASGFWGPDPA